MQRSATSGIGEPPEKLVGNLASRIRRHVLFDSLLLFIPLVLATNYAVFFLYRSARIGGAALFIAAVAIAGTGLLAVVLRSRPKRPNLLATARVADEKSGAKDHFLTLSSLDLVTCVPALVSRLRRDAGAYGGRLDLKRDFPYRVKRSAYVSLLGSLFLAALIHLVAPLSDSMMGRVPMPERLRQLAQQMAERPQLQGLARELEALAAKLEDPNLAVEEKQALVQEMEKKLDEQRKKEEQEDRRDLLAQVANALEGKEQQTSAAGKDKQKDEQKGGGGIESNLPQDGQGESKQSEGGSGEGERSAQMSSETQQGQSAQGSPKEPGQDRKQGAAKNDQPDPSLRGKTEKNEQATKDQGGSKDGVGRNRASEEPPPQGAPPEDRFYKAGEGKEGLKGARYVTVQLPEDVAVEGKGEGTATKDTKGNRVGTKVPLSNLPLPPHVPNAPAEKQQLPIEYRGIIR